MFGLIIGWLKLHLGLKTDAADINGSANAKLRAVYNKSVIKSIQRGVISLSTSENSKTATISAVNTSKAMVNFLGAATSSTHYGPSEGVDYAYTGHHFVRLTLTNGTTVTANRHENNGRGVDVNYEVIEYY